MSMSRKDFEAVATAIRQAIVSCGMEGADDPVVEQITENLADVFAADNSRFDRERFAKAVHRT